MNVLNVVKSSGLITFAHLVAIMMAVKWCPRMMPPKISGGCLWRKILFPPIAHPLRVIGLRFGRFAIISLYMMVLFSPKILVFAYLLLLRANGRGVGMPDLSKSIFTAFYFPILDGKML